MNIDMPSFIWKDELNYPHKDTLIEAIIEDYDKCGGVPCRFNNKITNSYMRDFDDSRLIQFSCNDMIEELLFLMSNKFEQFLHYHKINTRFFCPRIWYSFYNYGMETLPHTHCADFSGAYYLKYDKKSHNSTFFMNNNFYTQPKKELMIEPDVEEGEIIFFPSGTIHGSKKNTSSDCRILISFDFICPDFSDFFAEDGKKNSISYY